MAELKPCPFCGGKAEVNEDSGYFGVCCCDTSCIAHDIEPLYDDEHYASKAWNRRVENGSVYIHGQGPAD